MKRETGFHIDTDFKNNKTLVIEMKSGLQLQTTKVKGEIWLALANATTTLACRFLTMSENALLAATLAAAGKSGGMEVAAFEGESSYLVVLSRPGTSDDLIFKLPRTVSQ